nr:hypothetical protein 8 [Desulfobacteraceae bacterium]
MNKKVTLALALTFLLAAAGAILYGVGEILFIDSGKVEYKPGKSTKTSSGPHDSGSDQVKTAKTPFASQDSANDRTEVAKSSSGTHDSGPDHIKLAWDSVPGAKSYNLYWSTSPKVTKDNGSKIPNVTNPYTFKGIRKATTYYFVVTALNEQGESAVSAEFPYTTADR